MATESFTKIIIVTAKMKEAAKKFQCSKKFQGYRKFSATRKRENEKVLWDIVRKY